MSNLLHRVLPSSGAAGPDDNFDVALFPLFRRLRTTREHFKNVV